MYPILVCFVENIMHMATDKGDGVVGGVMTTMTECDIGPWFKSPKPGYNMF